MLVKESDTIEQKINTSIARAYKWLIDKDYLEDIDDFELSHVAKGGYINDYGFEGVDEGYKPYYEYLKQDLDNRKNNIYEDYNNNEQLIEIDNGGEYNMGRIKNIVNEHTDDFFADWAKTIYKREIDSGDLYLKDTDLEYVAIGGYLNDHNGSTDGIEEGYKPYYDYLKKDLEERKKVKEEEERSKREEEEEYIKSLLDYRKEQDEKERRRREEERQKEYGHMYCNPIGISVGNSISNMVNTITNTITTNMSNIISNSMNNLYNYNNTNIPQYEYIQPQYNYSYDYNNYYTPYSYEYDSYIDYYNNYNNGYNTYNDNINTTVDLTNDIEEDIKDSINDFNNAINDILDMIKSFNNKHNIFNSINNTKKKIINYISNYRPMYNKDKGIIEPVLIE